MPAWDFTLVTRFSTSEKLVSVAWDNALLHRIMQPTICLTQWVQVKKEIILE